MVRRIIVFYNFEIKEIEILKIFLSRKFLLLQICLSQLQEFSQKVLVLIVRACRPGDMSISMPSVFVSTNDMLSMKNSINSLLILQLSDGRLPYAGVPFSDRNATRQETKPLNKDVLTNPISLQFHVPSLQSDCRSKLLPLYWGCGLPAECLESFHKWTCLVPLFHR